MSAGVFTKPHPLHNVTTVEHFDTPESSRENSRVSSRRASPSPPSEKSPLKEQGSRKLSFPWSLKKSDSQCSLDHGHKHGWKPVTLTAPVLVPFAIISLLLVAILEVLYQESQRAGGLALSRTRDAFPLHVTFSYLFLPTIIAVLYSLFWSWIDLDAKRMQPWFEMSKDTGATAHDSLLLAYPYEFVATVPIAALRRRHWVAFFAGTTMVIIFWLVTPLQAAIFGAGSVIVTLPTDTAIAARLLPVSDHAVMLDQSVLNEAYAVTWLDQPYPPFTTPDYAIMPFKASEGATVDIASNFTGASWKYWTELNCWPAEVAASTPGSKRTFHFNNGRGCNASDISPYPAFDPETPYKIMYLGYQSSPWVDFSIGSPTCSDDAQHQFLAIWAVANDFNVTEYRSDEIDVEAVFCEASYHKQPVEVTVSADGFIPLTETLVAREPPRRILDSEFNITAFEYLIGSGVSSVELRTQRDFPFGRALEQYPKKTDLGLTHPMSAMTGFAVGLKQKPDLDTFRNHDFLGEAFIATQKMVFSMAFNRLLTNSTDNASISGSLDVEMHGIIVSRILSAIVEGLLSLIALLALCLWWTSRQAPCKLSEDPASLGSLIDICRSSPQLLKKLSGKGCLDDGDFAALFSDKRYKLSCGCETRLGLPIVDVLSDGQDGSPVRRVSLGNESSMDVKGHYTPVKPWALRRDVGVAIILVMTGVVALLAYLKRQEQVLNGLDRPNASFEVLQLLLNYLPTLFATALEPFWVLVNRLLCMLQPFKDLWVGGKPAKGSINARYTSIPPQMVFWRAAGSGHLLLSAICSVALLSNLLAVGLGGLFEERPVPFDYDFTFEQSLLPRLVNESIYDFNFIAGNSAMLPYEEHLYVVMNNISHGTPLPPWIGQNYFFQPFQLPENTADSENESQNTKSYKALSRGFGITPKCSSIGSYRSSSEGPVVDYQVTRDGEPVPGCPASFQPVSLALNLQRYTMPAGSSCAEVVDTVTPYMALHACDVPLILGWSRSADVQNVNGTMETSFVICEPVFETAMFEITVDPRGRVLDSVRQSPLSATLDYQDSKNHTDSLTVILHHMLRNPNSHWHNDTMSRDWVNYLLKIRPGSEGVLDPSAPLPDTDALIPHIETTYRQIYALMLGLNQNLFAHSDEPTVIQGTETRTEARVFMPLAAFIITLTVLGLNIITAIILYTHGVKFFLPRMPTTIGSSLAYIAPSRAVREFTTDEPSRGAQARTFSFGRYIGDDGRAHLGIELDPYVVPVKLSSLKKGNTLPGATSRLRRAFTRKDSHAGDDTWL